MSLLTRPQQFNQVVGQQRVERVLRGVLVHPQYMTPGYCFCGPDGVGKTTMARLFARALMCVSPNPLACRGCPTCDNFLVDLGAGLPDYSEFDAASLLQVDQARALIELFYQPRDIAKRRVILVDQAHRFPPEVWDLFLKPLEQANDHTVLLFVSTELTSIPRTITSRTTVIPLALVSREALLGHLMGTADRECISYSLDGLKRIAELSQGRPRAAITLLQNVALVGPVTPENCAAVIDDDLGTVAEKIFARMILASNVPTEQSMAPVVQAFRLADQAAEITSPARVIDALFRCYARSLFNAGEPSRSFREYKHVNQTFLRWTQAGEIPFDALSIFLMELSEHLTGQIPALATPLSRQTMRRAQHGLVEPEANRTPEPPAPDLRRFLGVQA